LVSALLPQVVSTVAGTDYLPRWLTLLAGPR